MGVTAPDQTRIVFCEGSEGSPDIVFLTRLLKPEPANANFRIQLKPLGGKGAAGNFARGYGLAAGNQNWIVLTDRDLDKVPDNGNLQRWNEKHFITGLSSIESYFLEPVLLQEHCRLMYRDNATIPTVEHLSRALQEAVRELVDYQSVRWGLQTIRADLLNRASTARLIRTAGHFDLPNRLTDSDGELPTQLERLACVQQAKQHVKSFTQMVRGVRITALETTIKRFARTFRQSEFIIAYKQWFHGKDVMTHWFQVLRRIDSTLQISPKNYVRWAAQHQTIDNNFLQNYPDLDAFREVCWHAPYSPN